MLIEFTLNNTVHQGYVISQFRKNGRVYYQIEYHVEVESEFENTGISLLTTEVKTMEIASDEVQTTSESANYFFHEFTYEINCLC